MNTRTYFAFGNGPNKSLAIEFHGLVGKCVLCIGVSRGFYKTFSISVNAWLAHLSPQTAFHC